MRRPRQLGGGSTIGGMLTKPQGPIALSLAALALAALACNSLGSTGPTEAPVPTVADTFTVEAPTAVVATDTPPTEAVPTEAPTEAAPTELPATAAPNPNLRLVVGKPDGTAYLLDAQGNFSTISEMQEPFYVFTHDLSDDFTQPTRAYNISSAGVFPLDVVQNVNQGFAAYVGPAAPNGLFAWDSYSVDNSGQVVAQIHLSSPDGSDQRVAYEETTLMQAIKVWRWAADGQTLYFSKEPIGLGGYIPYFGLSNIYALNVADGSVREVYLGANVGCVEDLTPDETLVAHSCDRGFVTIETAEHAPVASIQVPPEAESLLVGDVRFSPDASRVAFALALGVPDAEQGWAAVSDGLGTTAHLIATADAGTLFHVMAWLDGDTVVLQGLGTNPGVYLAKADGSVPAQRVGDGYFLGVIDNVAGQP